jgi:hypothetical protein
MMRRDPPDTRGSRVNASLGNAWQRFWFSPASPVGLGVCRVLFFGYLAARIAPDARVAPWAGVDEAFWIPTHLFAVARLGVAPAAVLQAVDLLWSAALVLACVGLATRAATGASLLLGAYVLGLPQCFGKIDHWSGLLVLVMAVLACARCGAACSIDALLARHRARRAGRTLPYVAWSGEYRWPLQLVRVTMALVFLAAGIAKLRFSGLAWLDPGNMAIILVQPHYALDRQLPALGLVVAGMPWLAGTLAALTLLAELASPLALLGGPAAALVVGTLLAMQLGIAVLLGVHASVPFLAIYAFWLPWDARARRSRWRAARSVEADVRVVRVERRPVEVATAEHQRIARGRQHGTHPTGVLDR